MTPKRTYINLINDFWVTYEQAQEPLSAPASMVYFYLLNRINRNRWQPVFISDNELATALGISRRRLPDYRAALAAAGLISYEEKGQGRLAGTVYTIPPETAPKGTINCAQRNNLIKRNCAQRNKLKQKTAPKGTINCAQRNNLTTSTPINNIYKTIEDIYINDKTVDAAAKVEILDVEEVEILEPSKNDKKAVEIVPAAAENEDALLRELEAKREKAKSQGRALLKFFFSNTGGVEVQCMQLSVTVDEYRGLAQRVINDWIQAGQTHDDYKGNFDVKEAATHLQNTIRRKHAAESRQIKSRTENRRDLMAGALNDLAAAAQSEGQAQAPAQDDNLF